MVNLFLFFVLSIELFHKTNAGLNSECWWTVCYQNTLPFRGCNAYGHFEMNSRNCQNGKETLCCPLTEAYLNGEYKSPPPEPPPPPEEVGCYWTDCHKNESTISVCEQSNMIHLRYRSCNEGSQHYCCQNPKNKHKRETNLSECWWTGCQKNNWAIVGCTHYDKIEKKRRDCEDGHEYFCCPGSLEELERAKALEATSTTAKPFVNSVVSEDTILANCWWTGCQKNNWAIVGCTHYNKTERNKRDCEDGHEYLCCSSIPEELEKANTVATTEKPLIIVTTEKNDLIGCWWTGCQKNDWAVVGCTHYNLTERDRRECEDGNEYHCCPGPLKEKAQKKKEKCWWSTCQPKTWNKRGCRDDLIFKSSEPCPDDGGDMFQCCESEDKIYKEGEDNEIEPITGGSFDDFVKYLLLKSHNFTMETSQLKCTQLDPNKTVVLAFDGNDGIRICDLCPNFPLIYIKEIFLDRSPFNTTSNVGFQECFGYCEANVRCLAYSYDKETSLCYMFNSTVGLFKSDSTYETVLMTQPTGVIENWFYTRHTSIAGTFYRIEHQVDNFRDCLKLCSNEDQCNHISYNLIDRQCKMYSNVSSIDYIDMNYGWLTALNISDIPYEDNSGITWRFTRDVNGLDEIISKASRGSKKLTNSCGSNGNSTHSSYFTKDCLTSPIIGCDSITGCRSCYYPEETNEIQNLPICPDSIQEKSINIANKVIKTMESCLKNDKCFGVGYDSTQDTAEEIITESFATDYQARYMLKYPKLNSGLHQYLLRNDFIGDIDFFKSGSITEIYYEKRKDTLEECLAEYNKNEKITRVSYLQSSKICKFGSNEVRMTNSPGLGIIVMIKHPDITSASAYYSIVPGADLKYVAAKHKIENCHSNCEEICSSYCINEGKSWCAYYTLKYDYQSAQCHFYEDLNDLKVLASDNSYLFKRKSAVNFDLESLNRIYWFQPDDIPGCFSSVNPSSDESNQKALATASKAIRSRWKRGFLDWIKNAAKAVGNAFKKVGEVIVDTVKKTAETVVNTAVGAAKTVGNLVKGDLDAAKDSFLNIPIVKDVKTAGEAGIALIKGDHETAKEKGAEFLQSGTLDLATTFIPGGKVIGKGLSAAGKAISNTGKAAKNSIKGGAKDVGKKSGKVSDKKRDKRDKDDGNNRKDDKNRDKDSERRGSQCDVNKRRSKRKNDKKRKPDDDCDDDDNKREGCLRPDDKKIMLETTSECNNRKENAKCNYECLPGYEENDASLVCKKYVKNKLAWNPPPRCELKKCNTVGDTLIVLETPKSRLSHIGGASKNVVAYCVLFDGDRKLPIWSVTFQQSQALKKVQKRAGGWKKYPCTALLNKQADDDDYSGTDWHKGHLTPANVALWSPKAAQSTNLYINAAPQDGSTNSGSWRDLEAHVQCFGNRKRILVATGICSSSIGKSKSLGGVDVPSCFWKMLCYVEDKETVVVGFKSDNSQLQTGTAGKAARDKRREQIYTPISQNEIDKLYKGKNPWISTAKDLFKGREAESVDGQSDWMPVNPLACAGARNLLDSEKDGWIAAFKRIDNALDRGKGAKPLPKSKKTKREVVDRGLGRGCTDVNEFKSILSLIGLAAAAANEEDGSDGDNEDIGDAADNGDGSVKVNVQGCGKRIIGYYSSWGKRPITGKMMQRLTHVVYAFLEMSADGSVHIGSPDRKNSENAEEETDKSKKRLEHLMALRKKYPHVKILFAVGGWENSQYFSAVAASGSMKQTFMTSVVKLIETWDFDGVDLDWEYPVTGGANEGVPADKQNYVTLMKDLRGVLDSLASEQGRKDKYLISFAGAAGQWTLDPGFDIPGLLKYADFANIMTYDYFGAWTSKWGAYTGPPAPLYFGMPPRFSGKTNAAWTVKYYTCKSKLPHKLNMGVPFYGRYWKNVGDPVDGKDGMWRTANAVGGKFEGGFTPWHEIGSTYSNEQGFTTEWHDKSKTPYAWNPSTKTFLGFENEKSLEEKVKYAVEKNVGGLMIWAIDLDDDDLTLLDIVSKAPLCSNTDPNDNKHVCSPIDEKRWWTSEDGDDKAGLCGKSAPLYKGYYPVCDPDDPGYSCCGKFGYCGTGPDFCDCPACKDYGKDPRIILEGAIKPSIPISWYLLNDPDGKRGRCGRKIEKINGQFPICNPDDDNAHCCSNGGYCGSTPDHCECTGCVNFRKNPKYMWGPKKWWTLEDGKDLGGACGPKTKKIDGNEAECDPDSPTHNCCSPHGWCGTGKDFCDCDGCKKYK